MNNVRPLICTAINDRYAWPWMVSIFSAKLHSKRPFDVALGSIKGNLSQPTQSMLKEFCEELGINLIHKEFEFSHEIQVDSRVTAEAYLKILWMDYLDSDFLWLDSDTLLLAKWDEIFEVTTIKNSDTSIIYTALDFYTTRAIGSEPDNSAKMLAGTSYFNSGVMFVRPNLWKAKNYDSQWKFVAREHLKKGFNAWDQDVLNYILREEKTIISSDYNFLVQVAPENLTARILHFASSQKPWFLSERVRNYFLACEILARKEKGKSNFMTPRWEIFYENYYRHENALLSEFSHLSVLQMKLIECSNNSRKLMLGKKDNIKLTALNIVGRKWF